MNELIRLIHQHGGTVHWRRNDLADPEPCTEHATYPAPLAVAEVTALDTPELHPCADCLTGAIERAQMAAEGCGERNPEITVTVTRPAAALVRAA